MYSPLFVRSSASMRAILTTAAKRVGEAARYPRVVALLPQRHHDQLAARRVEPAHVDDVAVVEVADMPRRPLALLGAARGPRAADAAGDLGLRVEPPADALQEALDGMVGNGDERRAGVHERAPATTGRRSSATSDARALTPR